MGARVHSARFVWLGKARSDDGPARLGLVVSRRVGNAVVRNRIKRLCRETFRLSGELGTWAIDIVLIAKPAAATMDMTELETEAARALSTLRRKCPEPKVSAVASARA